MTSRRTVLDTLTFTKPDRVPRQTWILPWTEREYPAGVATFRERFPDDVVFCPGLYSSQPKTEGDRYSVGTYVDEWGCRFTNVHGGVIGAVREPLIADWNDLDRFRPPADMLNLDVDAINDFCCSTDQFVLSYFPGMRPFERFQFIRTMEQALVDLLLEPPEMVTLLNLIHQHYLKEIDAWCHTEVDGIMMMDDWGTQQGMIVDPAYFRKYFKPMYRDYAEIIHRSGKYLFLHSDGNISEIIPDLIEVGVDALNSQLFCMNIEELGSRFKGKITFWGEIDRQRLLAEGTEEEIEAAVHRVYENLFADGGIIAQCEFGLGANPVNVFKVFETWDRISQELT